MNKPVERMLNVMGVDTYVRTMGEGRPVLFIHGGPGFSQRYMADLGERLSATHEVTLYDQPGCGRTAGAAAVTADLIFRHFAALARLLYAARPFAIVAHSWGALVPLGAAELGLRTFTLDGGVLVTPVPASRGPYDLATYNLFARIPPEKQQEYMTLAAAGRSEDVVRLMLPYYVARPVSDREFLDFNVGTFAQAMAGLGNFDFSRSLDLYREFTLIAADADFTTTSLTENYPVEQRLLLKGIGHFPTQEAPDELAMLVQQSLLSDDPGRMKRASNL